MIQGFHFETADRSPVAEQRSVCAKLANTDMTTSLWATGVSHPTSISSPEDLVQEVWKSSKYHLGILQFRKNWFLWTLESSKGQAKATQFCLREVIGNGHLAVCVILWKIRPIVRKCITWLFYVLIERSEVKLPKQELVFVLSESILIGGPSLPVINCVSCEVSI